MVVRSARNGAAAGRQAGAAFALELVELMHENVRVWRTSYNGGLSISRDCHTIGDNSTFLCSTLKRKVSNTHFAA